ncbi:metal tolerance protein B isoform X2 [Juglans microcarpa x Juglans regia]|uniref:metal tolerance protein B isoform X2 n=1 Tax=Juglans microcarpa x Juglans regia TaxID=2249226 RepID=UPI001B7EB492|nr:metal tolerance protein B isoform X2 [Juglans microcarpa x Juglans regia]
MRSNSYTSPPYRLLSVFSSASQMEQEETPILRTNSQVEIEIPVVSEKNEIHSLPQSLSCKHLCAFSRQENSTLESEQRSKSVVKLCGLIIFYIIVIIVEIFGGVKANSLAVITDAAHLLSDVAGLSISLFTVWASGWAATSHHSFGYNRLEVLGALLSVQLIWLISGILIYEAIDRILYKNAKVNGMLMFAIAAFGFIINCLMVAWLGHNHDHSHTHHACGHMDHNHDHEKEELCATTEEETNLVSDSPEKSKILNINVQGAYLHVLTDLIQSVGVMIAGAIIWAKPDWLVVDLICTLIFAVLALSTTVSMLRNICGILMERTPIEIDIDKLENGLKCIKGVQDVHDLHVWAITAGKIVLSCHVTADPLVSSSELICKIRDFCERTYRIHHVTVQIE